MSAYTREFVEALVLYLEVAFGEYNLDMEVRKIAYVSTGPQSTFYCNDLEGYEDIVIIENVSPFEGKLMNKLEIRLQVRGYVAIIMIWSTLDGIGYPE